MRSALTSLGRRLRVSLRTKLLMLVLLPILVVAPVALGFVVWWSQDYNNEQLLRRVNTNLVVAHDVFSRLQHDYLSQLQRLALSHRFFTAFEMGDVERVRDQLTAIKGTAGFDFLHVSDLHGRWILTSGAEDFGVSRRSELLEQAVTRGTPSVGVEVYSADDLFREKPSLQESMRLSLIPTPRAAPSDRREETRAMVIRAITPLRDANGTLVALLDGGVIINRDFQFVDAVRDLVYGKGALPDGSIGTVTVFLDDVRISTNVPLKPGERALGTRVSLQVRDHVLGRGEKWLDRAFVVNDWYISAYEPIVDPGGRRIGMLYAGFLEAPFRAAYVRTIVIVLTLLLLGAALASAVAVFGARAIARRIEDMASVARALRAGEDRRIGDVGANDEIGALARQFDETLDLLKLRNDEVRRFAEGLEATVETRTQELSDQNVRLEESIALLGATRRQLFAAEKLAALGEVTAGVAHEINNPIAIIQGNLEVMRSELGDAAGAVDTEVELVLEQIRRIHTIVDNLLRYSRSGRQFIHPDIVDLQRIISDTLTLVEHEATAQAVSVVVERSGKNQIAIDAHELQQVLVNLLLNAIQASPRGASVRLTCRDWDSRGVVVEVADQGEGVAAGHLARVFDPFFTTKGARGTGLGLSVSYGIVQGYGGDLTVRSSLGQGACFSVYLLSKPERGEDAA
ncbi:MAG: two-component system NtrC family sensor kinase [Gammaproteobacteria bacterium]|jgi:two-component system NtrC family sensor kinase